MRSSLFEVFAVASWCDEGESRGWCFWSKVLTLMCWGTKLRQNGSLPGTLWKAESWSSPASEQQRSRINYVAHSAYRTISVSHGLFALCLRDDWTALIDFHRTYFYFT
jgi:hypothetical protein